MNSFSYLDVVVIAILFVAWKTYNSNLERDVIKKISLNSMMNAQRRLLADRTGVRENRIVDVLINAALLNGASFFASTSIVALAGVLSFSSTTNDVLSTFSSLLFRSNFDRTSWIIKILGLVLILVYDFFKLSWAFRLIYYISIFIGTVPELAENPEEIKRATYRVAIVNVEAGRNFNRGLQAFFLH